MTEETETPKEEFTNHPGGIRLSFSSEDEAKYLQVKKEIEGKLANGEPVFCQFVYDDKRIGSVGRITSIDFNHRPANPYGNYWDRYASLNIYDVEVRWDGRTNKVKPSAYEIEYLPNWDKTKGTVWNYVKSPPKPAEPVITQYDNLGQELEPGLFVCFVHRRYKSITMKFGTITRITPRGTIFIKTLKLKDTDPKSEEVRSLGNELIIVNDKLQSRLVMARLATD